MATFQIGATDLTKWERKDQHSVNIDDVYTSWTDGNFAEHRVIVRTRITGTVVLSFARQADFASFLALLTSQRDLNGCYPVTVYCNNTGTTETITAYLDVAGDTKWDLTTPRMHHGLTVTISER